MKITIYDKYIFKQVLRSTLIAIILFTIVWIAPETLLEIIKKTLDGHFTVKMACISLCLELPKILGKAFPVGLLLGTLFTFDKLSKDSELTIFRAVGMSFKRILVPVVFLSVIITVLCFYTNDKLVPLASYFDNKMNKSIHTTQFIYTQKDEKGYPKQAIVVSKAIEKDLNDIMVLDFSSKIYNDVHELSHIYFAKSGIIRDDNWQLKNVTEYEISPDGVFSNINNISTMDILEGQSAKNAYTLMTYALKKERDINNANLWNYIKLLKSEGIDEDYRYMLNKYFQRYFHPIVCILLAILGCILGFSKPREQRVIGFTIAIGFIFLYYITLPFFDLLAEKGVLPPLITALTPLVAFLIAIVQFYKAKDL